MSKKNQKIYICCTAAKCILYYTKSQKRSVWETNLKEHYMFSFDEQQKQFEQVIDRTQAAYDFWTKAMFTTIKDIFNTTKIK